MFISWIPQDAVSVQPDEVFDPDYMSALFEFARERTLAGKTWSQAVGPEGRLFRHD